MRLERVRWRRAADAVAEDGADADGAEDLEDDSVDLDERDERDLVVATSS